MLKSKVCDCVFNSTAGTVGLKVILMSIKVLSSDHSQNEKPKSLIEARLDRQILFLAILWNLLGRQEDSITNNKAEELYTPSAIILPKTFSFINIVNWNTSFFNIPILVMLANSAIAQCVRVFYEPCVRLLATICRPPPVPLSCIAENCKDFFCKWKAHAICCFGSLSICFGRFPCFEI